MSISMKKLRSGRRAPFASLLLTVAAVVIHFFFSLRVQLLYDRTALGHHELWRLLTCHWVHLSWDHLLWSAMTFLGLGFLCEWMDRKRFYATVAVSALLIPAAIWWGMPDLKAYGGLSGLDCALYALLMVRLIRREIRSRSCFWVAMFALLLVGLIAKITYESITGLTIFVSNHQSGMVPVPLAHLVGGVVGTAVGLLGDRAGWVRPANFTTGALDSIRRSQGKRAWPVHCTVPGAARPSVHAGILNLPQG